MHQKFKRQVLSNSKLNLDVKNDVFAHFFFIEVQWTVIPNVMWYKFINMNEKLIMIDFLFLKPTTSFVNFKIFRTMVIWHIKWSINIKFLLWNVNDNKFFCVPIFYFGSLICSEVVADKSFSIGKPIRPRF